MINNTQNQNMQKKMKVMLHLQACQGNHTIVPDKNISIPMVWAVSETITPKIKKIEANIHETIQNGSGSDSSSTSKEAHNRHASNHSGSSGKVSVKSKNSGEYGGEPLYITSKQIGDGCQAKVYQTNDNMCVKVFEPFKDTNAVINADCEFQVASCLNGHPNIINIEKYFRGRPIVVGGEMQQRDFMVMEYCKNGDLYEFISKYTSTGQKGLYSTDFTLLKSMYVQLINAVDALHNKAGLAHLDIKLENILISDQGALKLCDFGFSSYSKGLITKKLGTESYMAPEIHEARTSPCLGQTADIFSLGVLFFILAFGAPPFHSSEKSDTYFRYIKTKPGSTDFFKFHPHTRALFRDGRLDQGMMELILALLTADPNHRIKNVLDVYKFDFIKSNSLSLKDAGDLLLQKSSQL